MKRLLICLIGVMLFSSYAEKSHAVIGIPDHVRAATLILPYFEVGINPATHPHDTLPVITNENTGITVTVHFEMWTVFGERVAYGNVTLTPLKTQPYSVRTFINSLSAPNRAKFEDGDYYRGFMTFDVVTSSTVLPPTDAAYPFGSSNVLEGWIYYVRLPEGSSNGLSMLPLEAAPPGTNSFLHGFYQSTDNREEIDADARYSADLLTTGGAAAADPDGVMDRVHSRLYLVNANAAVSKVIVFTFPSGGINLGTNFPGSALYKRYNENGDLVADFTTNLTRVVNVIQLTSTPATESGWLSLWNIDGDFETYAFSINSANPPGQPALTWDAIFESYVYPE